MTCIELTKLKTPIMIPTSHSNMPHTVPEDTFRVKIILATR